MLNRLNDFFDKVYVITLQRATDRHMHIKEELNGLNFELIFGVDKNNLDIKQLIKHDIYNPREAAKKHPVHKLLTPGEIACSLSHKMVYLDIIKNNYQKVLILEDDVVIDKNNFIFFDIAKNQLPKNWQLWYLGLAKNEQPPANARLKKWFYHLLVSLNLKRSLNHTIVRNLYPEPYTSHLGKAGFHDCTHAYAITQEAASILMRRQTPVTYTADNLLAFTITNNLLQAYISKPLLIYQQYQVSSNFNSSYVKQ